MRKEKETAEWEVEQEKRKMADEERVRKNREKRDKKKKNKQKGGSGQGGTAIQDGIKDGINGTGKGYSPDQKGNNVEERTDVDTPLPASAEAPGILIHDDDG